MQNGSVIRAKRQCGPDVWEFRWRETGADGKRKHRRMVLGSVEQLVDETAARQAVSGLGIEFNRGSAWLKTRSTTVSDLVSHYQKRELDPDTVWKTHSTKVTYEGYLISSSDQQRRNCHSRSFSRLCDCKRRLRLFDLRRLLLRLPHPPILGRTACVDICG